MAHFEINKKRIYIDNHLKEKIDTSILPNLRKKDRGIIFVIAGKEGSGKSTFALQLGAYIASQLNVPFSEKNIVFTLSELIKKIRKANKNDIIIYDEIISYKYTPLVKNIRTVNVLLEYLFKEINRLSLCVFFVIPSFFMLNKDAVIYKTHGLFYIYRKNNKSRYWIYFNEKNKKELYSNNFIELPDLIGTFTSKLPINEKIYKNFKRESLNKHI